MLRILPGMILRTQAGRKCAVTYVDGDKADLLFRPEFLMRDVPLANIEREYSLVEDKGRVLDAIEEICNDQRGTVESG